MASVSDDRLAATVRPARYSTPRYRGRIVCLPLSANRIGTNRDLGWSARQAANSRRPIDRKLWLVYRRRGRRDKARITCTSPATDGRTKPDMPRRFFPRSADYRADYRAAYLRVCRRDLPREKSDLPREVGGNLEDA